MTNADKIRSMTDEELAKLLDDSLEFFSCNECERPIKGAIWDYCEDCEKWILKFLQKNA